MINMNYQLKLDNTIENLQKQGAKPSLLLQACCAPCSSYVLEYLNEIFDITLLFFNPNISPLKEYLFRAEELKRLVNEMPMKNKPSIVVCEYDNEPFFEMAKGLEDLAEGNERCFLCYKLRLDKAAQFAKEQGFDYFCTTLSISPHKNAEKLNEIGGELSEKYGVEYLYSDFKKKNGYKRSIELSKEYNLYRQDYCGCVFSKKANDSKNS
ncbi:MAG: epoxyqueuosine reductase QueH [Clostridia bacterium]|nr:epoxyqueuosine reductase QueH [Clostridia bacterium]